MLNKAIKKKYSSISLKQENTLACNKICQKNFKYIKENNEIITLKYQMCKIAMIANF